MSSEKTTVLTKDTISRLLRDVRNIMKNPLTENGIYYTNDDEDILKASTQISLFKLEEEEEPKEANIEHINDIIV